MNPLAEKSNVQVEELQQQWIEGHLYPWIREHGGSGTEAELDRCFGGWLEGRELAEFERWHASASDVRRWCWSSNWYITPQDEELFLMADENIPTLLDEINAGCPKAEFALEQIVLHHMRDSAHEALKTDLRPRLEEMAKWLPALLRLKERHDVSYAVRLLGYRKPGKVVLDEARWRVYDLRRCSPDFENLPAIRRRGGCWVCPYGELNDEITIDVSSGKMALTASYQRT